MKKLTLKEAFALSVEKWEYAVNNNGKTEGIFKKLPHLKGLLAGCALCGYGEQQGTGCDYCHIRTDDGCADEYYDWGDNMTKANAQKVLDLIKEKQAAHLKRYYK